MDQKMVEKIHKSMEVKSTEELQEIRKKNDRNEYTEEAFEAIRQILEERDGNPIPHQNQPPKNIYATNTQSGGFFSFRTMVSRTLIQFIYILGAFGLSIYGIILIANATKSHGAGGLVVTGLGILLLGNLVWRIICEAWILLFNIHDVLVSIERKL